MARAGRLRRLVFVRAAHAAGPREPGDPPISEQGRAQMEDLLHHWEWAERVVSSPLRRARESASILARGGLVGLDGDLGPLDRGRRAGLSPAELRDVDPASFEDWASGREVAFPGGETRAAFRARVGRALGRLASGSWSSVLVVSHGETIREMVEQLVGSPLPPERPRIGELALATRDVEGRWRLGRRSSDPEPLRSPLERTGLLGIPDPLEEQHVASLELRLVGGGLA